MHTLSGLFTAFEWVAFARGAVTRQGAVARRAATPGLVARGGVPGPRNCNTTIVVLTISSADLVQSMIIQGFWGSLLLLAQKFTNNFLQLTHYSKKLAGAVLNFRTR